MNPLTTVALGGMLTATGLVAGVVSVRPAPPNLTAVLAQLSATPTPIRTDLPPAARWAKVPEPIRVFVERHVGVSEADLQILSLSRPQLAARKLGRAGVGLALPATVTALLAVIGQRPPWVLPTGFALALAAALWVSPSGEVRKQAGRPRAEFRAALRAFLQLVAQERAARGAPTEALEEASRGWHGWPYQLIHTEVLRAELAGQPPWDALRQLGIRLGIEELRALADIVATAADGAAVFDTLLAEARSLHHAEISAQRAEANAASERLVQPLGLLAFGFVLMILIPPLLRLFTT